jgi:hypothetical protein
MGKIYQQGDVLNAVDLNQSIIELVNTTASFTFTGSHTWNATESYYGTVTYNPSSSVTFNTPGNFNASVVLGQNAPLTSSNTISDKIGNVRIIPLNPQGGAYTLQASDVGKVVSIASGGISLPVISVFNPGDNISIYNNSSFSQQITENTSYGNMMYLVGTASTGNRQLAQRGLCTLLCVSPQTFIITGGGVT